MMLVQHDDAARKFAYDRMGHLRRLDEALDQVRQDGWTVVSMMKNFA